MKRFIVTSTIINPEVAGYMGALYAEKRSLSDTFSDVSENYFYRGEGAQKLQYKCFPVFERSLQPSLYWCYLHSSDEWVKAVFQ